jgi:hypothetical protein
VNAPPPHKQLELFIFLFGRHPDIILCASGTPTNTIAQAKWPGLKELLDQKTGKYRHSSTCCSPQFLDTQVIIEM